MPTHTKPDGSPFTPFTAKILAWRKGGTGSDRAYAEGVLIVEDGAPGMQRLSLWLLHTLSGLDGTTTIPLSPSGPKFTHECPASQAWAPVVQTFERKLAEELGEGWTVEIRLSELNDRPERIKRI